MSKTVRTRIAPSPTGMPHVGTLFQALIDYIIAKQAGGQFVVRIEDTDRARFVEGAEQAIYDAFSWAGITPDESPKLGGPHEPYRQSERLELYQKHAQQLIENDHAYYCFCTPERLDQVRREMQKQGKPPMYDKHCRTLDKKEAVGRAENEKHVVRLKVPADETITFNDAIRGEISFESNTVDDQVILKSDGYPTYHLAVVVDDHLMEITHIVRGEEWITSAPKHVLLYRYLNWDMPVLIHTPLLRNPDKSKLGKRHGHASVSWYQENGYLPEAVVNFLATRVWNHPEGKEVFSMSELVDKFNVADMHIQGPIVDLDKLNWYNGLYIRELSDDELLQRLQAFKPKELDNDLLKQFIPLIKDRLITLSDITDLTSYLYGQPELDTKAILKESKLSSEETAQYLSQVESALENLSDWSAQNIEDELHGLQQKRDMKPRPAFMTIRHAVTGRGATPPLFDTLYVLGKELCQKRLSHAQAALTS